MRQPYLLADAPANNRRKEVCPGYMAMIDKPVIAIFLVLQLPTCSPQVSKSPSLISICHHYIRFCLHTASS